jgi:hypothetical protein
MRADQFHHNLELAKGVGSIHNEKDDNPCLRCLFVNDLDVTAPCWKHSWLDPAATHCARHARPLGKVAAGVLRRCRNLDGVFRLSASTKGG